MSISSRASKAGASPWIKCVYEHDDEDGAGSKEEYSEEYWWNTLTGDTSWEHPPDVPRIDVTVCNSNTPG